MMKIQSIMKSQCKVNGSVKLVAVTLYIVAIASCTQQKPTVENSKDKFKIDSIKIFVLELDSAHKTISLTGDLVPGENVQIRSKLQGYIRKLNVDIGSKVVKGQVLALVDAPEISTRVKEFEEKVNASASRYHSSRDYYQRIFAASQTDGVIAAGELLRVKNQMMADSSEYIASKYAASSFQQAGSYMAIIAPFSGIITKRNIEVGSYVGSSNEKPLFELEDNVILRLIVPVPEIYTGAVLLDNSCEFSTRSIPDRKFKARLVRKAGSIDEQTRTEVWEFQIPNGERILKAGSYADVKLHFLRSGKSLMIPVSSVITTLEKKFVIKISGNTTQWVDVRPGFNMGERLEVFGELNAGDSLVLKATEELKAGIKVIPKL
jgi:membrane fusion protein, multidrug efflux system